MKKAILSMLVFLSTVVAGNVTAQTTEIDNGLNYLNATQNAGGSWGSAAAGTDSLPATVEVIRTLAVLGETGSARQAATAWLSAQVLGTTQELSSRIIALSAPGNDLAPLLSYIDAMRQAWGGIAGYDVDNLDTTLVLQALKALNSSDLTTIGQALSFLTANQNTDGGWGLTRGLESNVFISDQVSLAASDYF